MPLSLRLQTFYSNVFFFLILSTSAACLTIITSALFSRPESITFSLCIDLKSVPTSYFQTLIYCCGSTVELMNFLRFVALKNASHIMMCVLTLKQTLLCARTYRCNVRPLILLLAFVGRGKKSSRPKLVAGGQSCLFLHNPLIWYIISILHILFGHSFDESVHDSSSHTNKCRG